MLIDAKNRGNVTQDCSGSESEVGEKTSLKRGLGGETRVHERGGECEHLGSESAYKITAPRFDAIELPSVLMEGHWTSFKTESSGRGRGREKATKKNTKPGKIAPRGGRAATTTRRRKRG